MASEADWRAGTAWPGLAQYCSRNSGEVSSLMSAQAASWFLVVAGIAQPLVERVVARVPSGPTGGWTMSYWKALVALSWPTRKKPL